MCVFDICQLWNGLLLGTLASILATVLVLWFEWYRRKKNLKKKYGKIAGKYLGYGFEHSNEQWPQLNDQPQSEATIEYIRENVLHIELTGPPGQEQFKWTGMIEMDLETYGTVAWMYDVIGGKPAVDGNKHEFGVKKLMVRHT